MVAVITLVEELMIRVVLLTLPRVVGSRHGGSWTEAYIGRVDPIARRILEV